MSVVNKRIVANSAASSERRCSRNSTPLLYKVRACCCRLAAVSHEANAMLRARSRRMRFVIFAFIDVCFKSGIEIPVEIESPFQGFVAAKIWRKNACQEVFWAPPDFVHVFFGCPFLIH